MEGGHVFVAHFAQRRCTDIGSVINRDVVTGAAVLQSGFKKKIKKINQVSSSHRTVLVTAVWELLFAHSTNVKDRKTLWPCCTLSCQVQ